MKRYEESSLRSSSSAQGSVINWSEQQTSPAAKNKARFRPLRVLYFDHTAQLGGGEIALLNLVRFLDRTQVTPIVVLGAGGPLQDKLQSICDTPLLPLAVDVVDAKKDGLGIKTIFRLKQILHCGLYVVKLAR